MKGHQGLTKTQAEFPYLEIDMTLLNCMIRKGNVKRGNGRIINRVVTADKECGAHILGRFQPLGDALVDVAAMGNIQEHEVEFLPVRIFRVAADGLQRLLSDRRQFCVISSDASNTATGDDMPIVEDGIVNEIAAAIVQGDRDQKALNHVLVPCKLFVVEGSRTAQTLAGQLSPVLR
jgi:hypothetical protein